MPRVPTPAAHLDIRPWVPQILEEGDLVEPRWPLIAVDGRPTPLDTLPSPTPMPAILALPSAMPAPVFAPVRVPRVKLGSRRR
jgi:hypothetical protein